MRLTGQRVIRIASGVIRGSGGSIDGYNSFRGGGYIEAISCAAAAEITQRGVAEGHIGAGEISDIFTEGHLTAKGELLVGLLTVNR